MTIPFGAPIIEEDERAAVADVLAGPILVHGPRATQFEDDFAAFTKAPHAISVSSCTAGMHLTYFALGLGAGDEVIVPAQTHIATAHAVELTGAKPVFVDADAVSGNIDLDAIEAMVTPNTKAIAIVHFLGVPVDMARINKIAKRYGLFVLEDCALSPGATVDGVHTGLQGDVGVFSFYPVKHMTTAEGGMVITKDKVLADKLRLIKAFGVDRTHGERKQPGVYDTVALGFNYRMSELHAAIGVEQIKKLQGFIDTRAENFGVLSKELSSIDGLSVLPASDGRLQASHYCLSVILQDELISQRARIMDQLKERGIGSSIYYPQPVPRMTYYKNKYDYDADAYPNAVRISDHSIALPVGPHLDTGHMQTIAENLRDIITGISS